MFEIKEKNNLKKIAIVGGGFTGLTAAYRLAKVGYDVTIIERNNDLGGLASGFEIQGTHLEKTYHHIFKTDIDIINLVKELGLEESLMWLKSIPANYYSGKIYPFGTPKSLLLFKPFSLFDRIRTAFVSLYLSKTSNWKKYIYIRAYDYVLKMYGKNVTKILWEPLLKGKFSYYYDQVSMSWLWARMHTRLSSRQKGVSEEVLGYFDGGFNILIQELKNKLLNLKVKIETGVVIDEILSIDNKVHLKGNNIDSVYDKVIVTVPSHIFATMINKDSHIKKEYLEKLNSVNYLGAIVMVLSSDQKLGDYYWTNINDLSIPFIAFINHTNLVDRSKYNNKYIYYVGTYIPHDHKYFTMSDSDITKEWFTYIKKIFPYFDETQIKDNFIFKLKYAQHIVDLNYESKIPEYKTPIPNVYLSNFSQIFPEDRGTNFAVREGNKIADLVINEVNAVNKVKQ